MGKIKAETPKCGLSGDEVGIPDIGLCRAGPKGFDPGLKDVMIRNRNQPEGNTQTGRDLALLESKFGQAGQNVDIAKIGLWGIFATFGFDFAINPSTFDHDPRRSGDRGNVGQTGPGQKGKHDSDKKLAKLADGHGDLTGGDAAMKAPATSGVNGAFHYPDPLQDGAKAGDRMDIFMAGLDQQAFLAALAIALLAGFVKGVVGFAMPMIMVSGFAVFLPKELALAALILPTLATNISQAFRQGIGPVKETLATYRRFLIATLVCIAISAPFAEVIPKTLYLLLLGVPISVFAALQLLGRSLAIKLQHRVRAEWALGVVSGLYGGISGIWGPPLLVFLLSTGAKKAESVRAQGVIYLISAVILLAAHLTTGLANLHSLGFSAALCVPGLIGMVLGNAVQNRLDQERFRRWTQGLLVVTGLNMIRQALV